ncbi:MAG: tRNA lysidine(34) synthetase TilS [Thermoanaerobaculia bacterium]
MKDHLRQQPATPAERLATKLRAEAEGGSAGPWIVAFSGGIDSSALASTLANLSPRLPVAVHLLHVDHALDPESAQRAVDAGRLASLLGLPFHRIRRPVEELCLPGENLEAAARRVRYDELEEVRASLGADRILTAHHADDQAETVLLRLRAGSSPVGLSGIRERRGALWRPLLDLRRHELAALVADSGLEPLLDPTNRDLARDRNRLRHLLLPALEAREPGSTDQLARLAAAAARARTALERRVRDLVDLRLEPAAVHLDLAALVGLPPAVAILALRTAEADSGLDLPSSTAALRERWRQLTRGGAAMPRPGAVDRWSVRPDGRLSIPGPEDPLAGSPAPFSYTLSVPGEVEIPELGGRIRLGWHPVEEWMSRGEPGRAALAVPPPGSGRWEIRNRRPGDRLHPLGGPGMRRLKDLLIDRKVPRDRRDRIPLLLLDGAIAWVPGVTIAEEFRLRGEREALVAEWVANPAGPRTRSTSREALDRSPEEGDI